MLATARTNSSHLITALVICCVALQFACENKSDSQDVETTGTAISSTPAERGAYLSARGAMRGALRIAFDEATERARAAIEKRRQTYESDHFPSQSDTVLSFLFSANVLGETEECGCRANPLGGLARRHTLMELAGDSESSEAEKWWKHKPVEADASFVVDAGNLLFPEPVGPGRVVPSDEALLVNARALIDGLNASKTPDAMAVGQRDLRLGLDALEELSERARFSFLSANLYTSEGKRPFEGHRVVERHGKKVGLVALTSPRADTEDYFKERKVEIRSPRDAYVEQLGNLPEDLDFVLMLSNLGLNDTAQLVDELRADEHRVDAAIVSGTKRLSDYPTWTSGIPIAEPGSRGRRLGRLDIFLGSSDELAYANALNDPNGIVAEYRRTWFAYEEARRKYSITSRKLLDLERQLAQSTASPQAADPSAASGEAALKAKIGTLKQQLDAHDERITLTSKALARRVGELGDIEQLLDYPDGDDWARLSVVTLDLDLPQDPKVREALDKWREKRESLSHQ